MREYVGRRFDFMDRAMILKYCTFLKDLGMLFSDEELAARLEGFFISNYYLFELPELF